MALSEGAVTSSLLLTGFVLLGIELRGREGGTFLSDALVHDRYLHYSEWRQEIRSSRPALDTRRVGGQFRPHEISFQNKRKKQPTIPAEYFLLLFPLLLGRLPGNCQSKHQGGGYSPEAQRVLDVATYLSRPLSPVSAWPRRGRGIHSEPIRDPAYMNHASVWKANPV